ncbi:MAG: DUF2207 domain-containing protein [Erysipelotrichaceae bacterium]|nr:DUF2207 domain-containing protein [Erysipelotrichaceae bacterium]
MFTKRKGINIKIVKYFLVMFVFLLVLSPIKIKAEEAFDITNYKVVMTVDETGRFFISEEITTYFNYQRHGIYRNIPTSYIMNWDINGNLQEVAYNWPVENIQVYGDNYRTEIYTEGVTIQIGDGDRYVEGEKMYRLSYEIQTHDLGFADKTQMIYYNLIGSEWDTTIANIDLTVNLPKDINGEEIVVTSGYYGSEESSKVACEYLVASKQIHCTNSETLNNYESVTLYVPLANDYFTFPSYDQYVYGSMVFSVLLVLVFAFLYFKWGKDEPVITTVEFAPPSGLNSASVGYIIDNTINNRDITSLIIEWGKDGYLTIEDRDDDLLLSKVKDIDSKKPAFEKNLFIDLFKEQDVVSTDDLENSFYISINQCKQGIVKYFHTKEKRIYTASSIFLQVINCLVVGLPLGLMIGVARFSVTYRIDSIFAGLIPAFIVGIVVSSSFIFLRNQWQSLNAFARIFFALIIGGFLALVLFVYVIINIESISILYIMVGVGGSLALLFLAVPMSKRTEYGNRMYGRVLGLRQFIATAEEDRLKMLAEENPYIFYDILPYAYAFNLTKVWQKHFEHLDIPPADFYHGNGMLTNYMLINHLNRSLNSLQSSMVSVPRSSTGSGGGSFGGGGGGFSGGGFGGGGGGSW